MLPLEGENADDDENRDAAARPRIAVRKTGLERGAHRLAHECRHSGAVCQEKSLCANIFFAPRLPFLYSLKRSAGRTRQVEVQRGYYRLCRAPDSASRHPPSRPAGLARTHQAEGRAAHETAADRAGRALRPGVRARRLRRRVRRAAGRRSPTHETVERGAHGAREPRAPRRRRAPTRSTGDGAGILLQLPDEFFRARRRRASCRRPAPYGVARLLPAARRRRAPRRARAARSSDTVEAEGQRVVGWRDVPVDLEHVGDDGARGRAASSASSSSPPRAELAGDQDAFERKLYVIRRVAELAAGPDLVDPELLVADARLQGDADGAAARAASTPTCATSGSKSALALVHSRFSTNTFPSWELAHPYRMIAHNGEINTLRGNVNWMRARESQLASELFGDDLREGAAGRPPGRLGHGHLRQRARAARARGPLAAARDDDDDPRGLRRPRRHARRAARLLRLPRLPDGAVGRPGGDRVHRRHA